MASNLGKRKERDDDESHGSTLFVSNLPYTATSVDLETLFSDIAPVRTAFVVTEQGTGTSKGVGYVSFALKEDAESCYATVSEEGLSIAGRKIRVQWADKRKRKEEGNAEEKKEIKSRPRQPVSRAPHDPLAVRTVIVTGLPSPLDSKTLWKKIRKCPGAKELTWPIKKDNGEEDPSTAHVLFDTAAKGQDAVTKLHAHVYKGSLLSVTLKKRLEHLAKPAAAKSGPAPTRASRLIVRNLPFSATEQDLRAMFLPYGPVHSITMPLAEVKDAEEGEKVESQKRNKGFAFVWMLSKKDAERALEGCNGKAIRAGLAEELVSAKQKKKKQLRLEKKMKGVQKEGAAAPDVDTAGEAEADGDEEMAEAGEDDKDERTIAVDWALSKEKWKEEMAKVEEKPAGSDVEMDESSSDSEDEADSEDEGLGVHGDDDSDDESTSSRDGDEDFDRDTDDEEPTKPQLPAPEAGTTLFVRNVPYIATEDELRTLFRAFGSLRYARITMDPGTGRSRGTGFVCFWNKEDADKVVEQSDILRSETTGQTSAPKKNPFSLPSILTPDPSSSLARSLVLHGRTLDVVRAVTRDVASRLKEEGEKLREKQDKRNMYLLREGIIHPNSPAAASLSTAEIERRTASYNQRRTLLKSNPSLFISRTRLSVRQIPLYVSERMLKRLAIHARRAFRAEVKEGQRESLTVEEMTERSETALEEILKKGLEEAGEVHQGGEDSAAAAAPGKSRNKGKGRDTGVKQAKIVRQNERVDPITGKGRSKGYGFIEMDKHADALRVLRWANNNGAVTPLFNQWYKEELQDHLKREKAKPAGEKDDTRIKRIQDEIETSSATKVKGERGTLIVEFSIENIQVVQRRSNVQKDKKGREGGGGSHKEQKTSPPSAQKGSKKDSSRQKHSKREHEKDDEDDDEKPKATSSPNKRRKVEAKGDPESGESPAAPKKPFNPVGALIGRKRKEKKSGRKGKA
ncbi:hypothetical protein MD484_g5700, partial [Candolleomyces efflorescens]